MGKNFFFHKKVPMESSGVRAGGEVAQSTGNTIGPERSSFLGALRLATMHGRQKNNASAEVASIDEPGIEVKKFELTNTDLHAPFGERMI